MTKNDAFNEITNSPKWYSGIISPQSASRIIRKHREKRYRNYIWFFNKFNYVIENEESWVKNK